MVTLAGDTVEGQTTSSPTEWWFRDPRSARAMTDAELRAFIVTSLGCVALGLPLWLSLGFGLALAKVPDL